MQIAIQDNLLVHQMDVKTAYLNADIDCELYVEQPQGYIKSGKNCESLVCKLNKSLYGLKQSGRMWNNVLNSFLISENFVQSLADTCVYTKFKDDCKIIVIIWVDDLIVAASNIDILNGIKRSLCSKFKMKDLSQLAWFLGIEFKFVDKYFSLNQCKYAKKILTKFKMDKCNPKSILVILVFIN